MRAIAEDPSKKGLLYAGTEFGAFVSFNDGGDWNSLQLNLPNVPITDMEVTQNDLAISTQGRGFWILDKINVLQGIDKVIENNEAPYLFKPEKALRTTLGGGWRSGGVSFENDISFYLPRNLSLNSVNLFIKDSNGNEIINFKENTEYLYDVDSDSAFIYSGVHTIYWDLEHKAPKIQRDFVSMYYSARRGRGPDALPGNYIVEMEINGKSYSQPFNVAIDPRWDIPESELIKQFETANIIIDMIEESQNKLKDIRNITSQIKTYINLTKEKDFHEIIKDNGNEIILKLKNIEENLYQNKIETSQDEINYPRKWTNHITHLYDRITTDNQGPNDGMMNRLDELKNDYDRYIEPFDNIINKDLKEFTDRLKANGIQGIIID